MLLSDSKFTIPGNRDLYSSWAILRLRRDWVGWCGVGRGCKGCVGKELRERRRDRMYMMQDFRSGGRVKCKDVLRLFMNSCFAWSSIDYYFNNIYN